jgi:two-component system, chemotaxis family, protein-glutamate methylesterase/glutaminase
MTKLRVIVIEDSLTVRRRLCDALAADASFEVIGEAGDGQQAFDLCRTLRPDVVTMDMMLHGLSGLDATEQIMAHCPTPILVVSASLNRGELFKTYDALAAGAVDVLDKPGIDEADAAWDARFRSAVRMVAKVRVITHPRARLPALARPPRPPITPPQRIPGSKRPQLIAIGASTGGPGAVVEVLRAFPANLGAAVALVLHIGAPFSAALAVWLESQTGLSVSHARDGEPLAGAVGRVVLAPADHHLVVRERRYVLVAGPPRFSCRPSVDVLFESVAADLGAASAGCLLTGMGRDGAAGLLSMRNAGATTVAQDEATSVVYGMPREAALIGAAQRILPLPEIGPALAALTVEVTR